MPLAELSDLNDWMQTSLPDNAEAVLRSCSVLVLNATRLDRYDTDSDGDPTDAEISAAFNEATCIQAAAWISLGIDPFTGGIDAGGVKASKGIGTAKITYAGAEGTAAAKAHAAEHLVPQAVQRLQNAGLLSAAVAHS